MKYNENSLIERSEDRRIRLERWDKDERFLRERERRDVRERATRCDTRCI